MGRGPSDQQTSKIFAEYGTWNEYKKLKAAQAADAKAKAEGGESLLTIPRGKYPKLDAFDDLLETGARISREQRFWLVGIPVFLCIVGILTCAYMGSRVAMAALSGQNLSAAEILRQWYKLLLVVCVVLAWTFLFMLAALSPTNVKSIYNACIGLIFMFTFCGGIMCPFLMPQLFPDRTGTTAKIWMFCAMAKCVGFVVSLVWALFTQPPRKCLRVMEWGTMGVIIGFGTIQALAAYYCVMDSGTPPPEGFWFNYALMSLSSLISGFLAVTEYPRMAGRKFLERLHKFSSPTTSFDFQCLAATIAVMVGADSNFRAILCKALGALRAVSMADVTWDEFRLNKPDPLCYSKSRPVSFEQVDYFVSHSWSDDPHAKWEAIQKMRADFKAKNGREPLVWFDKYCIDQTAIDMSVRRLPIFVVASSKFFVLFGPSYASRCWCMLELYVFNSVMRSGLFKQSDLVIAPLKSKGSSLHLEKLAATFNIHDTQCMREVDRQTIFGIVEAAGDGHKGFDAAVRALAAVAAGETPPSEGDTFSGTAGGGSSGWYRAGGAYGQEMHHRGQKTSAPPSPPSAPSPTSAVEELAAAVDGDLEAGIDEEQ